MLELLSPFQSTVKIEALQGEEKTIDLDRVLHSIVSKSNLIG